MTDFLEYLKVIIPVSFFFISYIVWNVRIEGKVKMNEKLFNSFKEEEEKKENRTIQKIDMLFELTGKIKESVDEIRGWKENIKNNGD